MRLLNDKSLSNLNGKCHHGFNEGQIRNKGGQQCENISKKQRPKIFTDFWKITRDVESHYCRRVFPKILENGHMQMKCDSAHVASERALRDKKIYVPSNHKTYMEEAPSTQPYKVEYLKHDFFKTYKDLLTIP